MKEAESWTIRRVLTWAADDLRGRGFASPRLDVELLLAEVLRLDRVGLVIDADRPLSKTELAAYRALHQRRRSGEPIAYLRGVREFYGRPFRVDARVLVPRPETEILVEVALDRTKHVSLSARVLDLCTGSGCVAITFARERPTSPVLAIDTSNDALDVARENAMRLSVAHQVGFVQSDLFEAVASASRFELVTANPPYIADDELATLQIDVREFEPKQALLGGADGLAIVRRIITDSPRFLVPGGVLAMELGAGQAPAVAPLFEQAGFLDVQTRRDYAGHDRVVSGRLR